MFQYYTCQLCILKFYKVTLKQNIQPKFCAWKKLINLLTQAKSSHILYKAP